jgi:hypothetical protein
VSIITSALPFWSRHEGAEPSARFLLRADHPAEDRADLSQADFYQELAISWPSWLLMKCKPQGHQLEYGADRGAVIWFLMGVAIAGGITAGSLTGDGSALGPVADNRTIALGYASLGHGVSLTEPAGRQYAAVNNLRAKKRKKAAPSPPTTWAQGPSFAAPDINTREHCEIVAALMRLPYNSKGMRQFVALCMHGVFE